MLITGAKLAWNVICRAYLNLIASSEQVVQTFEIKRVTLFVTIFSVTTFSLAIADCCFSILLDNAFGFLALLCYLLTLIATWLRQTFKLTRNQFNNWVLKNRRYLGVMTFGFSLDHLATAIHLPDLGDMSNWANYSTGLCLMFLISLLTFTSNNLIVKKLKKDWKKLHRLTYLIFLILPLHIADKMANRWTLLTKIEFLLITGVFILFFYKLLLEFKGRNVHQRVSGRWRDRLGFVAESWRIKNNFLFSNPTKWASMTSKTTEKATNLETLPLALPKQSKSPSLFRRLRVILIILLLAGFGWGGWLLYQQKIVAPVNQSKRLKDTVPVSRQDLTVTVTANGTVQPELSVNVSPKTSGILRRLFVKEGDRVEKGQLLAKMDDDNLQGQLLQAQGQVAEAEANLQKLANGNRSQDITQAQAELFQAQSNLEKLKNGNRSQDITQAQAELFQAQSNLKKLKNGNRFEDIAQAQARLENALANQRQADLIFRQNRSLYEEGAIADRDWENSRTQSEAAAAQVREAKQALALQKIGTRSEDIQQAEAVVAQKQAALSLMKAGTRPEDIQQAEGVVAQKQAALSLMRAGTRPEDIQQAKAQLTIAKGNLKTVQTQIEDTEIRAPFNGIVARKYADPGAFVTPTTAGSAVSSATSSSILALAARNQIVTNVSESNIAQMRLGQKATIKADAYPDKIFKGKVSQISPQSIVQQNVTSFEVKVTILDDPQNLLRSGMNVQVEFSAGKINNVLVIPTIAIVRQTEGTGVYLWKNNQADFVPITTGITVNDKTEVRSGLSPGDKVLITFPDGKRPVSEVRNAPSMPGVGGRSRQ